IDVAVTRVALVLIDQHEAAGIAQALDVSHRRNAAKGWQQHGEAMVEALRFDRSSTLVVHCHIYVTGIDGIDLCIGNPLDVPLPELRFHRALRVADPAEPHVPDVRLARHEGYRHLVPDTALAQVLVQDQRELVSRAEATGALHGADDDGTRVRDELLIPFPRILGMIERTDRDGVAGLPPEARDLVESEFRAGGQYQVVVFQLTAAGEDELVPVGLDPLNRLSDEVDARTFELGPEFRHDFRLLAPPHGHPWVRRDEPEGCVRVDQRDPVRLAELVAQLERG